MELPKYEDYVFSVEDIHYCIDQDLIFIFSLPGNSIQEVLENTDQWIQAEVTIYVHPSRMSGIRDALTSLQIGYERLNLCMPTGNKKVNLKDNDGKKQHKFSVENIGVRPVDILTPERFSIVKPKLELLNDYLINKYSSNRYFKTPLTPSTSYSTAKIELGGTNTQLIMITYRYGFFIYTYPLIKRLDLERENKKVALQLFGDTFKNEITKIDENHPIYSTIQQFVKNYENEHKSFWDFLRGKE